MSHFNLGVGPKRTKFIGPQHRLPTRPTSSIGISTNLENVGGRIMVENEMVHHKLRMREVKPSVDTGLPWAHRQQSLHTGGGSQSRVAQKITDAAEHDRQWGATSNSSRPQSATAARPASASRAATRLSARQEAGAQRHAAFDVSQLTTDHQRIYRDMVRVLCTLEQSTTKALLEHMYREAEDKKLLGAYTGVFPDEASSANRDGFGADSQQ